MVTSRLALLAVLLFVLASPAASPGAAAAGDIRMGDLKYVTEQYYPYNFHDGETVRGISAELLRMVWERLGEPERPISLLPWARAYEEALLEPGTVIFSMARTAERENLFRWACPIDTVRFVLFAKAETGLAIHQTKDMEGMRVGTVRGDVAEQALRAMNLAVHIEPVADMEYNLKKLEAGRLDMVAYEERSMRRLLADRGMDPEAFEPVFLLKATSICYAFHKSTPMALVERFQEALDQARATPDYDTLRDKYLK